MAQIIWKSIGIKLETQEDIEIACGFLRIKKHELIEYMLEALGLTDIKMRPKGKKNPFLNSNYRSEINLDYERYKLSLLDKNSFS